MNLTTAKKRIGRFFGWVALSICSLIARFLPVSCLYVFANTLGVIGYWVLLKQRRIAQESLSIALGKEKSPGELKQIARDCFTFMARSAVEVLSFMSRPELVKARVTLQNKHILDQALSRGKGIILVSGHFGNFPLMMLRLVLEGYSVGGIMRQMRDPQVEKMFARFRSNIGIKTIHTQPRKVCISETMKALKNNEIVCIQLDQNFGTGGIFVDFFGQKAATATGPIVFALRTQAALIPCFIIREQNNTHRVILEPEFELKQEDDYNNTIQFNIQKITALIESYIKRYPAHWGWVHRRWKTRPKP